MNTAATAPKLASAVKLAEAMEAVNAAQTFAEFNIADKRCMKLGLRLRRGFYIQRRSISQERIELVLSATDEKDLAEIIQDINYDEIML